MTRSLTLLRTAWALGLPSIVRVLAYRLGVRLGLNPVRRIQAHVPQGPFWSSSPMSQPIAGVQAPDAWKSYGVLFGYRKIPLTEQPPDWLANPLTGAQFPGASRVWWKIPDFDSEVGDIKLIWELSRMDWLLAMAQQARQGDGAVLSRMNVWLVDWCRRNPPYRGPNWKCGQEASIRVMNLAMATSLLGQVDTTSAALRDLVRLHLRRIAPTMSYAIGQDNNHGTSEAAALFIGGEWLHKLGVAEAERWARQGRRWLEDRAQRLIAPDGSFSQYSLNYHRLMLDTYSTVELWRRHLGLPAFSSSMHERLQAAQRWLYEMIDSVTGDGPNVGANDGARLLPLADVPYRDFRPSVQLAAALFSGERAYAKSGPWNDLLLWCGLESTLAVAPQPASCMADDGGFTVLRRGAVMTMLRYPRFRFRPSQSDALHLDFWRDGDNLLRDGGTFGYSAEQSWQEYFNGPAGHNTVQFDDRAQMPRLGRFLLGDWLKTDEREALSEDVKSLCFGAAYRDGWGAKHRRRVVLTTDRLNVTDDVAGFQHKAVLRWRLAPGLWVIDGTTVRKEDLRLSVLCDAPIARCELVQGWESRYYLDRTPLPVLEVEIAHPGTLVSELVWSA
jgi:hypothetical protein